MSWVGVGYQCEIIKCSVVGVINCLLSPRLFLSIQPKASLIQQRLL